MIAINVLAVFHFALLLPLDFGKMSSPKRFNLIHSRISGITSVNLLQKFKKNKMLL